MKRIIVSAFLAALLLGCAPTYRQTSIGLRIGPPPAPRVVTVVPRQPSVQYVWIEGYWYPTGNHYKWRNGYWAKPPYARARWVSPRYDDGRYFEGYWVRDDDRRDRGSRDRDSRR